MWLYFFWAQFFVTWFGNLPNETEPLWRQMYGHYAPYFWIMMAGCFFVPFVALVFAFVKRSIVAMCILAAGINLGIWIYKYLTVIPAFSPDDLPFESWLDVSLAVGLAAGFLAAVVLLASRLPMYSNWELALKPPPRR
jgi:molybdopterin-containing oxidoreductase family membrane subunit